MLAGHVTTKFAKSSVRKVSCRAFLFFTKSHVRSDLKQLAIRGQHTWKPDKRSRRPKQVLPFGSH